MLQQKQHSNSVEVFSFFREGLISLCRVQEVGQTYEEPGTGRTAKQVDPPDPNKDIIKVCVTEVRLYLVAHLLSTRKIN